jgi:hypothetical protein
MGTQWRIIAKAHKITVEADSLAPEEIPHLKYKLVGRMQDD